MTATLAFNLPEESVEHQVAIDGWKWKALIDKTLGTIRNELKYGNPPEDVGKKLEQMMGSIYQWMAEDNLSIDS